MDFPIYPRLAFGPRGPGLRFGLVPKGLGIALARHSFGLGEWDGEPIFLTPSGAPSPCVRNAWARAVTLLVSVAISTRLFGAGLVKALSPSYVL